MKNIKELLLAASSLHRYWPYSSSHTSPEPLPFEHVRKPQPHTRHAVSHKLGAPSNGSSLTSTVLYMVNVTIGNPPQLVRVQVDTGSSDTWVPYNGNNICSDHAEFCEASGVVNPGWSETYHDLKTPFQAQYLDGTVARGTMFQDDFSLGGYDLEQIQLAGVISIKTPYTTSMGILGLGYSNCEANTDGSCGYKYPNVLDEMRKQGMISKRAYSVWLGETGAHGSILFGAIDRIKYVDDLTLLPIIWNRYEGALTDMAVEIDSIHLTPRLRPTSPWNATFVDSSRIAVLDTGSEGLVLPDNVVDTLLHSLGLDEDHHHIECRERFGGANVHFRFFGPEGPVVKVSTGDLLIPDHANSGNRTLCRLGVFRQSKIGTNQVVLGDPFLRSAYVVFHQDANLIAIAQSNTTHGSASEMDRHDIIGDNIPYAVLPKGSSQRSVISGASSPEASRGNLLSFLMSFVVVGLSFSSL